MSRTAREDVYVALFNKLKDLPGLQTWSRRWKPFSSVNPADQPALFMTQRRESSVFKTRQPTIWTMYVDVSIYAQAGSDSETPASVINPLLDALEDALAPSPALEEQTLGGLVERCRIDGDIITDEGLLGNQGYALVPITILLPAFR